MLDEGFMAVVRAETMQQEREDIHAALQYAASLHCLVEEWKECEELKLKPKEKWTFVDQRREETKHRTEWRVETNKYRCMRCGRGSKYMKMPEKCTGPKYLSKSFGKWRRRHLGVHDLVRRMDRQEEILILVQKMLRLREAKNGTETEELLQARASGHKRVWQNVKTDSGP